MERFLRDWRQDALNKAQYDSAIFIGDKLLAMTSAPTSCPASYPIFSNPFPQKTITTPFGWPKSTSLPATTRARTTS